MGDPQNHGYQYQNCLMSLMIWGASILGTPLKWANVGKHMGKILNILVFHVI